MKYLARATRALLSGATTVHLLALTQVVDAAWRKAGATQRKEAAAKAAVQQQELRLIIAKEDAQACSRERLQKINAASLTGRAAQDEAEGLRPGVVI